ncbi:hypothetical protein [Deinococcus planocerae]|uniref:hypothetical protein n=1 Tax=Deinococcus planocerae TaxID=1737569 RepID=UPI000C7F42E7|nr:hypothetical protein [Deinococcus planocerae]
MKTFRRGGCGLALLLAAVLGTAQAGGSATQTIRVKIDAFTRGGPEAAQVALTPTLRGQGQMSPLRAQGVGTLGYTRTGEMRLVVGAAQTLPTGWLLEVRLRGEGKAVRLGDAHGDLVVSALLPGGTRSLALDYVLGGAPEGAAAVPVVFTILDP